ncbi:MAG: phenylalanine--tRNA ligase subunit beta [Deltaproteobacteria bacterium]|nr:phenylalanine--tRNA ligase subunit beta [Deltaproteobacteria bacterium]
MKFTLNWLKEFVEVDRPPQEIAGALTMAGLEVESLTSWRAGGEDDWLMEIAVTPNRGDCLGILGIAREVAALFGCKLKCRSSSVAATDLSPKRLFSVRILSADLCPRYSARLIRSLHIAPSPEWMQARLEACGIRAINSVVDVTNYVMLETGQPLHAFDFDRLKSKRIVVREAGEAEKFVTLDGNERSLSPHDLLICDGATPIALAGIMGGQDSEVGAETRWILLESAHFDPLTIRRTSKRLGLQSEASHRFERGVDPEGTVGALDRASVLLGQVAGGDPEGEVVDRYPRRKKIVPISLRDHRVRALLGVDLQREESGRMLERLGIRVQGSFKGGMKVLPPSYRSDLVREADLIEELGRVYGYERISPTLPLARPQGGIRDRQLHSERKIRSYLTGAGLAEVINLPFTSGEMNRRFSGLQNSVGAPVVILNPLVQESTEMRFSLVPGLLGNLHTNLAQKAKSLFAFELGKSFFLDDNGAPAERQCLAALLYGSREYRGLRRKEEPVNFLDTKGLVEGIFEVLGVGGDAEWTNDGLPLYLHPGRAACARLGGRGRGHLGQLHPEVSEELDLPSCMIVELDFDGLLESSSHELKARALPRFPGVERDLAVVVDGSLPAQSIIRWITALGQPLIEKVVVFDQYRGSPIPEDKKSLAYRIFYRAEDRTLTDAEVNAVHQDLISQISQVFGAQLRS